MMQRHVFYFNFMAGRKRSANDRKRSAIQQITSALAKGSLSVCSERDATC